MVVGILLHRNAKVTVNSISLSTSVVYTTYLQQQTFFSLKNSPLAVDLLHCFTFNSYTKKIAFNFSQTKFDDFLVMQNLLCCVNTPLWVIDKIFFFSLASCVPLQALSDGKIQNNDIKHGALVSFSCNDGFQMKGSRILKCIDGKWNGSAPTCKGLTTFRSSLLFIPFISLVCTFSSSSSSLSSSSPSSSCSSPFYLPASNKIIK